MVVSFLEKDLEDIIWQASTQDLRNRGLWLFGGRGFRQLKVGNYGVLDMVFFKRQAMCPIEDGTLIVHIVELKKDIIDTRTLLQAVRYAKGIQRYITNTRNKDIPLNFRITLIGKSVEMGSSFIYLTDLFRGNFFLEYLTYDYRIDGLHFKSHSDYSLVDEGFEK